MVTITNDSDGWHITLPGILDKGFTLGKELIDVNDDGILDAVAHSKNSGFTLKTKIYTKDHNAFKALTKPIEGRICFRNQPDGSVACQDDHTAYGLPMKSSRYFLDAKKVSAYTKTFNLHHKAYEITTDDLKVVKPEDFHFKTLQQQLAELKSANDDKGWAYFKPYHLEYENNGRKYRVYIERRTTSGQSPELVIKIYEHGKKDRRGRTIPYYQNTLYEISVSKLPLKTQKKLQALYSQYSAEIKKHEIDRDALLQKL